MSRSHFAKRWGAEPDGEGRWRFRLWAPDLDRLAVAVEGRHHAMEPVGNGWFETHVAAAPGAPYAFVTGEMQVPDPAARAQAGDVHGPSRLVDPRAYDWRCDWKGRPWEDTILYELHVGTFSPEGTFDAVRRKLDHLAGIGVTAVELCPVAQFAGDRGWGYDGVLLYAPHPAYGSPEALKALIDAAHERQLMVFVDVVYNHFGPDGNYLHAYADAFFHDDRSTPWGPAIAFDRAPVRQFFIDNALYWLEEYRFDGLRLDATDQIADQSEEPILTELARAVRAHDFGRPVHLTTEDDRNITGLHGRDAAGRPQLYDGEWNDDFHHVAHVIATGERDGYYGDYAEDPRADMLIALRDGYVQQGRASPYRGGERRGEPSAHLPPPAFVNFLQNHDQTGNRAFGERLTALASRDAVEVMTALLLLSPMIPLVFMGEEWGERRPFRFFCDFHGELAEAVRKGRREEFSRWSQFADPRARQSIPDPNDPATFAGSRLDWAGRDTAEGAERMALFGKLTAIRAEHIAPRLAGMTAMNADVAAHGECGVQAGWRLADGTMLRLLANLGGAPFAAEIPGEPIHRHGAIDTDRWAIEVTIADGAP
ncbi:MULTISPECIES: malto-oligosyltrehalose trehalohydrolase [unclassified Roseitalea]|uniref:malto-oligosyltrehalose trehalohydrolase n=1 Tax=unclassified Roseitalea TaxID=2639107 RepID=UPI00273D933F|nr:MULTISPECIES: malto-oligosyltrehalose trehalohydrolase [unclassified Roseitalea]